MVLMMKTDSNIFTNKIVVYWTIRRFFRNLVSHYHHIDH